MDKITLNYEEMVAAYWDSLNTVLRGFNAQGEFLDLWVPDEDGVSSILNLVEAVQETGYNQMELDLTTETAQEIDLARLQEELVALGTVNLESTATGYRLQVNGLTEGAAFHNLHAAYVAALRQAYQGPSQAGELSAQEGLELVHCTIKGVGLSVLVEPQRKIIQQAKWQGAEGPLEVGMMNACCQVILGLSLLEAADHGVLRLEDYLRDERLRRPAAGIVIPEKVEPAFGLPLELLRGLLSDFRKRTGYDQTINFFVKAYSNAWQALDGAGRKQRLQESLDQFLKDRKLNPKLFEVLSLDEKGRVTLASEVEFGRDQKAQLLLQLERHLDKHLEENLHLYVQELEDKNSKRRKTQENE